MNSGFESFAHVSYKNSLGVKYASADLRVANPIEKFVEANVLDNIVTESETCLIPHVPVKDLEPASSAWTRIFQDRKRTIKVNTEKGLTMDVAYYSALLDHGKNQRVFHFSSLFVLLGSLRVIAVEI